MQGQCCVFANLPLSKCHLNFNSLYWSKDPGDNLAVLHFHHLGFFTFFFVFALLYALRIDVAPCGQL